jgi:hypothetical protein
MYTSSTQIKNKQVRLNLAIGTGDSLGPIKKIVNAIYGGK